MSVYWKLLHIYNECRRNGQWAKLELETTNGQEEITFSSRKPAQRRGAAEYPNPGNHLTPGNRRRVTRSSPNNYAVPLTGHTPKLFEPLHYSQPDLTHIPPPPLPPRQASPSCRPRASPPRQASPSLSRASPPHRTSPPCQAITSRPKASSPPRASPHRQASPSCCPRASLPP